MTLALTLFSDADGLDDLIEASMPGLMLWLVILALAIVVVLVLNLFDRFKPRSPVEKLLRRRFG